MRFTRLSLILPGMLLLTGCDWFKRTPEKKTPCPLPHVVPTPPKPPKFRTGPRSPLAGKPFFYNQAVSGTIPGIALSNKARNGILVDLGNHRVLWEKNSQVPVPIASITKLLTMYTAMEMLEPVDKPHLESLVTVSLESCRVGPVKAKLIPGEKLQLRELLLTMMVHSANDSAHQVAEFLGDGDDLNFVRRMNATAQKIGMTSARFFNASGLPIYGRKGEEAKMNVASMQDIVTLAEWVSEYPLIMNYTGTKRMTFRKNVEFNNSNRLLLMSPGVDGLKTGYTGAAGHCLAFSAFVHGRRLVGVVAGFQNRNECFQFSKELLEWGFRQK